MGRIWRKKNIKIKQCRSNNKTHSIQNLSYLCTSICSKYFNEDEIISQFIDTEGRIILLNINIKDTIFTLVCLYAPNCKKQKITFSKK